jgi:hypothetical protein
MMLSIWAGIASGEGDEFGLVVIYAKYGPARQPSLRPHEAADFADRDISTSLLCRCK